MKPSRSGFTLVELMLAVLILAIMMSIVYGVVVSTINAAHRVEEITASSEIGPAILTQIRSDLEAAFLPKKGIPAGADPQGTKEAPAASEPEFFVASKKPGSGGDRDRIDFVSSGMAYGPENEIEEPRFHSVNEIGYQVLDSRKDPNVGVLYRREDYFIDSDPLRGGRLTELYDRVKSFSLRFHDGQAWRPDWNSKAQKGLPRAVEIVIKILVTDREDANVEQTFKTTVTFLR